MCGFVTFVYIYLATGAALPLQDAAFAAFDRSLGFDWIGFVTFTNSIPTFGSILTWAYQSAIPQTLLLYLFLSFTRREERLAEFLALSAMTGFVVGSLALLFPAVGATAFYRPDASLLSNFGLSAGMYHYHAVYGAAHRGSSSARFHEGGGRGAVPILSYGAGAPHGLRGA